MSVSLTLVACVPFLNVIVCPLDFMIHLGILTLPGTMGRGFTSLMGKWHMIICVLRK